MREILFRGKRTDNGEWVEGYAFDNDFSDDKRYFVGSLVIEPDGGSKSYDFDVTGINFCEVDPETICQYTGLTDKNGKKIWEGDILEGHLDDKFPEDVTREKVIWHENGWKTEESRCDDKAYLDEFDTENFEVVGNVFDNPELLEV